MITAGKFNKTLLYFCISFVIMLAGNIVPIPEPVTRMGMQILFIFAGMIFGWCISSMMWPSLLGIMMLGLTQYMATPQDSFIAFITNSSVLGMITSFIVFGFLSKSGLLTSIAKWLVTRKTFIGKPWKFIIALTFVIVLAATIFHAVVTIILFFNLVLGLLKDMGYTKDDMLPTYLLLGIAIIPSFMAMAVPFMPNALFIQGLIQTSVGTTLSTVQYLCCITLPGIFTIIIWLAVGKFIIRVDTKKFVEASSSAAEEKVVFTEKQKNAAVALVIFILGVGLPSFLPTTWLPIAFLNRLGIVGVSIAVTIGLIILNGKDGTPIATFKEMADEGYGDFSAIVLTGAILLVGGSVTAEGTGIAEALSIILLPLINKMSVPVFLAIISIALCTISQISMNMVLMMIFSPLLAAVLVSAGQNPLMAVMVAYLPTNLAFLAPSGSMPAALVFSRTDWVEKKNLYKILIPWIIISLIVFIVVCLTFPDLFCSEFRPQ